MGYLIPTWSWHQIRQPHIREYEAGESGANFTSVYYIIIQSIEILDSSSPSAIYASLNYAALVKVMACRLFGAKSSPKPMLTYHQSGFLGQN